MNLQSPWWYRTRGLIFGIIYLLGFAAGPALWQLSGRSPFESTVRWVGNGDPRAEALVLGGAVLSCFICWALRAWGSAYLNADVVWNADAVTEALIVQGPFRYTRSPLYLGNIFMALGVGALATPYGFAIIVLGSIAFILQLVAYETAGLRARYGSLVDDYVRAVPALLWRLTPCSLKDSGGVVPSVAQGLRSEIFTACVFVAMLIVAVFGGRAFPLFAGLLAVGWVAQHLVTSRPSSASG